MEVSIDPWCLPASIGPSVSQDQSPQRRHIEINAYFESRHVQVHHIRSYFSAAIIKPRTAEEQKLGISTLQLT